MIDLHNKTWKDQLNIIRIYLSVYKRFVNKNYRNYARNNSIMKEAFITRQEAIRFMRSSQVKRLKPRVLSNIYSEKSLPSPYNPHLIVQIQEFKLTEWCLKWSIQV